MKTKSFDPTKPVQTRDGRKARIICTDAKGSQPIVALVDIDGEERERRFDENGEFWLHRTESPQDLINIPPKHTVTFWVNVYNDGSYATFSEEHAAIFCGSGAIARKKVTIEVEEGEGLE